MSFINSPNNKYARSSFMKSANNFKDFSFDEYINTYNHFAIKNNHKQLLINNNNLLNLIDNVFHDQYKFEFESKQNDKISDNTKEIKKSKNEIKNKFKINHFEQEDDTDLLFSYIQKTKK